MKASQSRQKPFARKKPLQFIVGDHVFPRVSPTKGVGRVIKKKLSLKCVGPYQILNLHNVFHVSQLSKVYPRT